MTTDEEGSGGGGGVDGQGGGGGGGVGGGGEGGETGTGGDREADEGDTGADSGGASGGRGRGAGGPAGRGPARHTRGGGSYQNSKSNTTTLTTFKIFIKLLSLIHRKNILLFKRKVQEWGRVPLPSLV